MDVTTNPQATRSAAPPPTYEQFARPDTLPGMDVQLTHRPSKLSARFPNTIREYRLKAGLSQRKLAAMLGRSKDAVSSWERGQNLPSVPLLMRMAKILGTLAESLYHDYYAAFSQDEGAPTHERA